MPKVKYLCCLCCVVLVPWLFTTRTGSRERVNTILEWCTGFVPSFVILGTNRWIVVAYGVEPIPF